MADKQIHELTAAAALDGSEIVHAVQGGNSRKVTLAEIAALGGAGWELAGSWEHSVDVANVDIVDLAGYNELLILARLLTTSVSTIRQLRASTDNGSSFPSASGDYQSVNLVGTEAVTTQVSLHSTSATAARSGAIWIPNAGLTGVPKLCQCLNANTMTLFVASLDPINAIRVFPTSGNLQGGSIQVLGR